MRLNPKILVFSVMFAMIVVPFSSVFLENSEGSGRFSFSDYHNGTLNLNVTYQNGTPAEGLIAEWDPENIYYSASNFINATGQVSLDIKWELLGQGDIRIRDTSYANYHIEHAAIFPDEVVYKDIVVQPYPSYDREITGTVKNRSSSLAISGVIVRVTGQDQLGNYISEQNTTGVDGGYSIMVPYNFPEEYTVHAHTAPGYITHSKDIAMKGSQMTFEVNFDLVPEFSMDGLTRIRYINTTTSQPIKEAELRMGTTPVDFSHRNLYYNKNPDTDGWFEIDSGKGESILELKTDFPEYPDTDIDVRRYLVQNGTAEDIEYDLTPPSSITYNFTVRNSTDVLTNARISWSKTIYRPDGAWYFNFYSIVCCNGSLNVNLPQNEIISVRASANDHETKYVEIDTGSATRAIDFEIILEEDDDETVTIPTGTVRIEVVDNGTDLPIKGADIYGYVRIDDGYYSQSVDANDTGVFEGEFYAGTYGEISATCAYGSGSVSDVEVVNGTNDPMEIRIERDTWEAPPTAQQYYATFKEPSGDPVPDLNVFISTYVEGSYAGFNLFTDSQGRVYFNADPGANLFFNTYVLPYHKLYNPWVFKEFGKEAPATPGDVGDVILQPRGTPDEVYGFTRDSVTGDTISGVWVTSVSYHPTESTRMMMMPPHAEGIRLFTHETGSMQNGFYRTWGMDHMILQVFRDGYYPKEEEIDLTTRAPTTKDILLDPMGDVRYWVNGTVVDKEGTGIEAYVEAYDNDHPLLMPISINTEEDGSFSMQILPGNYTFMVSNATLMTEEVVVVDQDLEGIEFVLEPQTMIFGAVTNSTGDPAPRITIILEEDQEGSWVEIDQTTTNATGFYSFMVKEGDYRLRIERTELYDPYLSEVLISDGIVHIIHNITLENRTVADVFGKILGEEGPLTEGIGNVNVSLMQGGEMVMWTLSSMTGEYLFEDVPHGIYRINADPPEELEPVADLRSGYLENLTDNFTVAGALFEFDVILNYQQYAAPSFINVTFNSPEGEDVYLDEPILIEFSQVMNPESLAEGLVITPEVGNLSFNWNDLFTLVSIDHDDFQPDTNYSVRIQATVISFEGFPMWDEFRWNFTTGNESDPWDIFTADVTMDDGKNVTINVTAPENLTIYMFLFNVNYTLLEEGPPGTYTAYIDGDDLDWETEYYYFFTGSYGGLDRAPEFSGTFVTPDEPYTPPVWSITEATLDVRDSGTWDVNVRGPEGQTIYIVIEGVGSFLLEEDAPGYYRVLIPYENFEWESEYDYHFSDTDGGEDMATGFSGTATMPLEPSSGSGGDDDPPFILCCVGIIAVLVIILVVVLILVFRKRGGAEDFEE